MAWLHRDEFKRRLDEYQSTTGKTQAQVAVDLGTTYGTLRFWLSGTRAPGLSALQSAAGLFRCSVTEFIDDPGVLLAGEDVSYLSDQARFFAGLIVKDMAAEDLTDEDRKFLYQDFLSAQERIRAIRARTAGGSGQHRAYAGDENGGLPGTDPRRLSRKK